MMVGNAITQSMIMEKKKIKKSLFNVSRAYYPNGILIDYFPISSAEYVLEG